MSSEEQKKSSAVAATAEESKPATTEVERKEETVKSGDTAGEKEAEGKKEDAGQPTVGVGDVTELVPEEEVTAGDWVLPSVQVKKQDVPTGEEDEIAVWQHRAALYRWADGEWKQRGLGDAKLMKDTTGKIRLLMRQEKTGKLVANHYVIPEEKACILTPNAGNDKIWVWSVVDCAEEPYELQQFGLRFGDAEAAKEFKKEFENAGMANLKLVSEKKF